MNDESMDRRSFFRKSGAGLVILGCVGVGYSAYRFLFRGDVAVRTAGASPGIFERRGPASGPPPVVPKKNPDGSYQVELSALSEEHGVIAAMAGAPRVMVREGDKVRVFDATCTHLGCLVKWDPKTRRFLCPCHGGIYDRDGRVVAGPPPGNLREHKVEVAEDSVKIAIV